MLDEYLELVSRLVSKYGYLTLFFGVMIENIFLLGLVFPGLFILTTCGFFAATGNLDIYLTLIIGCVGTIMGDNLSYLIGRSGLVNIDRVRRLTNKINFIEKKLLSKSEQNLFILFYHFPVYARMVVPTLLGIYKYNFKSWFFLNSVGALIFSSSFIVAGYLIGKSTQILQEAIDTTKLIQLLFFILFIYFFGKIVIKLIRK
jgi:membrane-associated protein